MQSHELELTAALSTGRRYECVGSCRLVKLLCVSLCVSTRTRHRRPRPRHEHRREGDVLDRRHLRQHHRTHCEFSPHAEASLSPPPQPLDRKARAAHESHELRSVTPPLSIRPLSHTVHSHTEACVCVCGRVGSQKHKLGVPYHGKNKTSHIDLRSQSSRTRFNV